MNVPLLDLKKQYQSIQENIHNAIHQVLERGLYTLGPESERLEKNLASYCNANYALSISCGTDALLLALLTINIQPGDEVITSPFSFFASAEVISFLKAKPVFVDIDPQSFCMDPSKIESVITKKTKAIIPVHIFGQCADMAPILLLAKKHNFYVIEDACQAIGAEYKKQKACSLGDFGALSFYPSKNLGTYGEGGMLFVKNKEHYLAAREYRTHGEFPKSYQHKKIGMNARLGELEATILNVKLKHIDQWNEKRRKLAKNYFKLFKEAKLLNDIIPPFTPTHNTPVFHLYSILTKDKWELRKFLQRYGIQSEIHFPVPIPYMECYKNLGHRRGDFPETENICEKTLTLPMYPEMTWKQQSYVVSKIKTFYS